VWCARILFYSVVDAAAWPVSVRYLASASALGMVLLSISIAVLVRLAQDCALPDLRARVR
jgi:hypothetical protein